tara:strand:- start:625 stop:888 length:264 start_codon:yes stop_codon:yes gene_type:complete
MKTLLALLLLIPSLGFAEHQGKYGSVSDLSFCEYTHLEIELGKRSIEKNRELKVGTVGEERSQHEENILKGFDELSNLIISYNYFCK